MPKNQPTPAFKYLTELVDKFPDAPALTLAKRAYREHPELWSSLETVRNAIRRILGVHGAKHRRQMNPKMFRAPRKAGWSGVIPEGILEVGRWKAVEIAGPHRALILSDCHIPFHDPQALELALEYGEKRKPTLIILNGDIMDHYGLSEFEKDPRQRDFPSEVKAGKFFLKGLRQRFPKALIYFKEGNHEFRFERYLRLKAPDLLGIPDFEWCSVFGLNEYRIEHVKDKRPIRLGALNVLHGHEHRMGISTPVNPARGLFLRAKCHALCGHWHQSSQHSERNLEQKVITTWSTGCLCDIHPAYAPINSWSQGAAFVEVGKDGGFQVENFRIVNGKCW